MVVSLALICLSFWLPEETVRGVSESWIDLDLEMRKSYLVSYLGSALAPSLPLSFHMKAGRGSTSNHPPILRHE